jgi:HSP20 family protein
MLMRFDPFREFDRLTEQLWGGLNRPAMPMDAYRQGDRFVVHFDLPGVDRDSIEVTVEQNVLNVSAQRAWQPGEDLEVVASERPHGRFSRQLFLGEGLDTDHIEAHYNEGVLTITAPAAEQARARRVEITSGAATDRAIGASSAA